MLVVHVPHGVLWRTRGRSGRRRTSRPMKRSLYRKYRPQRFDDLVGQEHVARTLAQRHRQRPRAPRLPLHRPARHRARPSTARILAMALNCEPATARPTATPCGTCRHCESHPPGSATSTSSRSTPPPTAASTTSATCATRSHFAPARGRMQGLHRRRGPHAHHARPSTRCSRRWRSRRRTSKFVFATTEPHKVPRHDPLALPALRLPPARR